MGKNLVFVKELGLLGPIGPLLLATTMSSPPQKKKKEKENGYGPGRSQVVSSGFTRC